jgi:hypothetical protein
VRALLDVNKPTQNSNSLKKKTQLHSSNNTKLPQSAQEDLPENPDSMDNNSEESSLHIPNPVQILVDTIAAVKDHFVEESQRNKEMDQRYGTPPLVPLPSNEMTGTKGEIESISLCPDSMIEE